MPDIIFTNVTQVTFFEGFLEGYKLLLIMLISVPFWCLEEARTHLVVPSSILK